MKTKGWNGYGERGIKILEVREGWKNGNYFFVEIYIYVCVCVDGKREVIFENYVK